MSNKQKSGLEFYNNLFSKIFEKKRVVFYIGNYNVTIAIIDNEHIIKSVSCYENSKDFKSLYKKIISKYSKYPIVFAINNKDVSVKNENIPYIEGLLGSNPVELFIEKNYKPKEIKAYKIDDSSSDEEIINCSIASSPFRAPVSSIMNYISLWNYKFRGLYFMSLEFPEIIDYIIDNSNIANIADKAHIFITITKANGLKVILKNQKQLIAEKNIEIKEDISNEYIQGLIEHEVQDLIINHKDWAKKNNLEFFAICYVNKELKKAMKNMRFKNVGAVILSNDDIASVNKKDDEIYKDAEILYIFNKVRSHLALNAPMHKITKIALLDKVIYYPFYLIILFLTFNSFIKIYEIYDLENKNKIIQEKYNNTASKYRGIKASHPDINKLNESIELFNAKNLINKNHPAPKDAFKLLSLQEVENFDIVKNKWQYLENDNKINLDIHVQYIEPEKPKYNADYSIENYCNKISSIFSGYDMKYEIKDKVYLKKKNKYLILISLSKYSEVK